MKKRLEAELISIAHRILKLKNKSEVDQLYKETQKLYETLSVLKFYQDNFEQVNQDVSLEVLEEKLAHPIEASAEESVVESVLINASEAEEAAVTVSEEVHEEVHEEVQEEQHEELSEVTLEDDVEAEEVAEEAAEAPEYEVEEEAAQPALAFQPIFSLDHEAEEEETVPAETASEVTSETKKVVVEEFLGENYSDPVFVKPDEVSLFASLNEEVSEAKSPVVNESAKSIAIGLNDRIGFVKHLFDESNEDFNRVLSQLNSFDSFDEAKNFIDDMVKPDYNNWQGNEDYAERFMELIEHKFQ
jgi:hypothetical protein